MSKVYMILLIFASNHSFAQNASWADTVKAIEKVFSRYTSTNPGAQLAISRNGQVIFSRAWGMADLEHNVPLTNTSVTEAGSVSKQFTAAAILLLEQQGKLSLGDDVRKYVPELPDYGTPITLAQMMTHTSGFRDWGTLMSFAGWPRGTKTYRNEDALLIAARQKELNHKPGAEFLYSNTNYNLFAVIVQRLSGLSLADFTNKYIFQPAGMKNTQWRNNYKKVVPNRAIAYSFGPGGYETEMPNEYVYGNGGLLTTAEDLLAWNNYYTNGRLGNLSLLAKQIETARLNNGRKISYAAGLFINKYKGWQVYSHDGATAGYRSNLEYFPELGLSIAFLSNTSRYDTSTINPGDQLLDIFLKDKNSSMVVEAPLQKTIPVSSFSAHTGWYIDPRNGAGQQIIIRNDKIFSSSNNRLIPVSENVLELNGARLEFTGNNLRFISAQKDTFLFTRADSANINSSSLLDYTGNYYSEEAEAKYAITIVNGKLNVHQDPSSDRVLVPTYRDGFVTSGSFIYFERDKSNKITGFRLSSGRARKVIFKKVL